MGDSAFPGIPLEYAANLHHKYGTNDITYHPSIKIESSNLYDINFQNLLKLHHDNVLVVFKDSTNDKQIIPHKITHSSFD